MRQMLSLALLAMGLTFSVVSAADDPEEPPAPPALPKFTCTLRKPKDECSFSTGRDGVVLRIVSESGIGGARLTLTEGEAPRRLTVQFPRMRNLEAFSIGDGKIDLNGSLGSDASFDKQGQPVQNAKNAAYSLKIRQGKEKDLIEVEVTLPRSEAGTKEWQLSWIDAYRR